MARRGSAEVVVGISTASGSTVLHNITQYVDTLSAIKQNALNQETHTFGDSWLEVTFAGVRSGDDITVGGHFDDVAASGPNALFGTTNVGAERHFEVAYDTATGELFHSQVLIASYSVLPTRGELTRYESVLKVTGAVTTAS